MAAVTRVHLVRHGEVHNPAEIFYGRLPGFHLSAHGRHQAEGAARVLQDRPLAALFTSPMLRADQTAEIVAAPHRALTVQMTDLLNEVHVPVQGRSLRELAERGWPVYAGSEPPFEQPQDVLHRVQRFVAEARQQWAGHELAAVTHGDVIAVTMLWAKGIPPSPGDMVSLYLNYVAPASVTTFTYLSTLESEMPSIEYSKPYPGAR